MTVDYWKKVLSPSTFTSNLSFAAYGKETTVDMPEVAYNSTYNTILVFGAKSKLTNINNSSVKILGFESTYINNTNTPNHGNIIGGGSITFTVRNAGNVISGANCKFEGNGINSSNIITGSGSTIDIGKYAEGNIIAGSNLTIKLTQANQNISSNIITNSYFRFNNEVNYPTNFYGNFIISNNATFNDRSKGSIYYRGADWSGNLILGGNRGDWIGSKIYSGDFTGNIIGGQSTVILGGRIVGNVISGNSTKVSKNLKNGSTLSIEEDTQERITEVRSTWILGSSANSPEEIEKIDNRYGLMLIGVGHDTPYVTNDIRYRIFYPNKADYPAQLYGYKEYTESYNVLDKNGEYVIKNGELNVEHPSIIAKLNELIDAKLAQL